jgi:predicted O-methyltransferase YrrM
MQVSRWLSYAAGALVTLGLLVPSILAQAPAKTAERRHPTAEEVSRQFLSQHPKPRDEGEERIIAVMKDMYANQSRGMGNVLPEDGRLMRMLTETLGAKHVVEVGTAIPMSF